VGGSGLAVPSSVYGAQRTTVLIPEKEDLIKYGASNFSRSPEATEKPNYAAYMYDPVAYIRRKYEAETNSDDLVPSFSLLAITRKRLDVDSISDKEFLARLKLKRFHDDLDYYNGDSQRDALISDIDIMYRSLQAKRLELQEAEDAFGKYQDSFVSPHPSCLERKRETMGYVDKSSGKKEVREVTSPGSFEKAGVFLMNHLCETGLVADPVDTSVELLKMYSESLRYIRINKANIREDTEMPDLVASSLMVLNHAAKLPGTRKVIYDILEQVEVPGNLAAWFNTIKLEATKSGISVSSLIFALFIRI
jgi:hypothetical protein